MVAVILFLGVMIIVMATILLLVFRDNAKQKDVKETDVDQEVSTIHISRNQVARRPRAEMTQFKQPDPDPTEEKIKSLPKLKKCRMANIKALWREGYIDGETYRYLFKKYDKKATVLYGARLNMTRGQPIEDDEPKPLGGHKRLIEEGTYFDQTRKWGDGFGLRDGGESHIAPRKYKVDRKNIRKDIRKAKDRIIDQIIQDVREQEREQEVESLIKLFKIKMLENENVNKSSHQA